LFPSSSTEASRTELHISAADRSGDQRTVLAFSRLLGGRRAELKDRLETFADLAGSYSLFSARAAEPQAIMMAQVPIPLNVAFCLSLLVKIIAID